MKRRFTLALLAPALLLLSGCFDVQTTYEVNEDGSGTQTVRFAIPPELATSFGEELPTEEELQEEAELEQLQDALGEDGSMRFFSNTEEGVGFEMVISVEPTDDFGAALQARADAIAAAADEETSSMLEMTGGLLTLHREGDTWTFEQQGQPIDEELFSDLAGAEAGDLGDGTEAEGEGDLEDMAGMASMFLEQTTITTRLKLPGEVTEHNADEVLDDGTLVWNQTGAETDRTLMARSDVSGGGLSTMVKALLLIGGIAIVLLIAGYFLFGRKRASATT